MKNSQLSRKLNHKKIDLFIIKKKSEINCELKSLDRIKIYLVFYILLLESTDLKISIFIKKPPKLAQNNKYKVKKITEYNSKIWQYIIK